MALTNSERIGKALDFLNRGLEPFVEREMKRVYDSKWLEEAVVALGQTKKSVIQNNTLDTQALLTIIWTRWNEVFRDTLGHSERSMVSELREVRNNWAHQQLFSTDDGYRALDSISRLLEAISAPEASEVEKMKLELLRVKFDEQARNVVRRSSVVPIEGQPVGGLKPWREVVTPHPDVASGGYQQAEFAADLWQVHVNEGASEEYRNPVQFFRRTFITEGLKGLLVTAIKRLSNTGGDPVVELQTNFGGGKTHSMLALYHLFSGVRASELPGLESVLSQAGVQTLPSVRRVVLVGTKISPGMVLRKTDGTQVRTLWGELAYQLGGREGFEMLREADETSTSPGDALTQVFKRFGPSLILIDEWVAYARQLHDDASLPGGSFETHFTFAQTLSEAAKAAPGTFLVVSIPASEDTRVGGRTASGIEIGGQRGQEALERLKNAIGRLVSPWRPASGDESFEIVRRRLFQEIPPDLYPQRDAVVKAFAELYRTQASEFPSNTREGDYERKLKSAYPIHPELFERLYTDWSTLEKFQRTRGVLRLMAAVIHELWERDDRSLMILPANVPVDASAVQSELTRYMDDPWVPVIERDVDGPDSVPLRLDRENANLGRYSACRRVARALYLGSAPTLHAENRGVEDNRIKLGCAQPGETVAVFGDALRRLTDQATHLYVNGQRYWFDTQPSVTRLAQDRADALVGNTRVFEEIGKRIKLEAGQRVDFARVHDCPNSSADVPDEPEAALVILGPEHPHSTRDAQSAARTFALEVLERRGPKDRTYRNTLVFLAPDRTRLTDLEQAVRQYLAWKSIEDDAKNSTLNLDTFQRSQANTKSREMDAVVKARIPETFLWLLVPEQPKPTEPINWQETRLQGQDALTVRAAKKLRNDAMLATRYAHTLLRGELDSIPLWRGDHVSIKQLADDFATYLYLQRLHDTNVLFEAIREGVGILTSREQEGFAYADAFDIARNRYVGLRVREAPQVSLSGVVVKSDVALRQQALEQTINQTAAEPPQVQGMSSAVVTPAHAQRTGPATQAQPTRFHAAIDLDAQRAVRDVSQIATEVLQHLTALVGADVIVTLEIQAKVGNGVPEHVVRTVSENAKTLKFKIAEFEET